MPKVLTVTGMAVAGLLVLLFGLDLAVQVPFGRPAGAVVEIVFLVAAAALGYMSWNAFREQV
jgi:hypothetical protein